MKNIAIKEVSVGAQLAADLKNEGGSLILGQGATLSMSVLARLEKMGIQMVPVEIDDPEELEQERRCLEQAIEKRFSGTNEDPFLQELKRIAIEHVNTM